jgi:hypothetical protein
MEPPFARPSSRQSTGRACQYGLYYHPIGFLIGIMWLRGFYGDCVDPVWIALVQPRKAHGCVHCHPACFPGLLLCDPPVTAPDVE